jgi:hypothetical protein
MGNSSAMNMLQASMDAKINALDKLIRSVIDEILPSRITKGLEIVDDKLKLLNAQTKMQTKKKLDPIAK